MKDYSKYFENPCSFITNILVDKEKKEIYVTFANNIVNKYPCTKENIKFLYQRLEDQYKESIANESVVSTNKARWFFIGSALFAGVSLAIILGLNIPISQLIVYGAIGVTGISLGSLVINETAIIAKNRQELKLYESFLNNSLVLKKASEEDENILLNVSVKGQELLDNEKSLVENNLISEEFNVNFMDKASLSDLKTIATQLKIYQGLQQPVKFIEDKPKTKKRIKEQEETK